MIQIQEGALKPVLCWRRDQLWSRPIVGPIAWWAVRKTCGNRTNGDPTCDFNKFFCSLTARSRGSTDSDAMFCTIVVDSSGSGVASVCQGSRPERLLLLAIMLRHSLCKPDEYLHTSAPGGVGGVRRE